MNDSAKAIMDAAERHIWAGGLCGFSFRDITAEIGMKSSSVHYHFPPKAKVARSNRSGPPLVTDFREFSDHTKVCPLNYPLMIPRIVANAGGSGGPISTVRRFSAFASIFPR
jgi:hypothetical protein